MTLCHVSKVSVNTYDPGLMIETEFVSTNVKALQPCPKLNSPQASRILWLEVPTMSISKIVSLHWLKNRGHFNAWGGKKIYLFICGSHLRIIWQWQVSHSAWQTDNWKLSIILTDSLHISDSTITTTAGKWGLNKSTTAPSSAKQPYLASWHSLHRDKVMTKVLWEPTMSQTEGELNLWRLLASLSHKRICLNVGQEVAVLSKWFSRGCLNDTSSLIAL